MPYGIFTYGVTRYLGENIMGELILPDAPDFGTARSEKVEACGLDGLVVYRLFDEDGNLKLDEETHNLVTQVGDQFYGERAVGLGSLGNVTGMRLGTGVVAVAKTDPGASIGTYVTSSNRALDGGFPASSLNVNSRRIAFQASWAAGVATATGISEAVLTIETPLTNVAGTAANTIARALLSPVVNKAAGDTLVITWYHDLLGA
jgi:hypothetical protein